MAGRWIASVAIISTGISVTDIARVPSAIAAAAGESVSFGDGGLEPLVPARILDTREGNGAPTARIGADTTIDLQVAGRGGVPTTGAGAVVINITAVQATAPSFVTAWPTGANMPIASNLNVQPGDTIPNLVIVKLGTDGKISLYNAFGDMDLIADVAGWFPEGKDAETTLSLRAGTVLAGSGDVISYTGSSDTGATVVLAASADVPKVGGHLAIAPHAAVPEGLAGRVASVTGTSSGTTTVVLSPAALPDMFTDLDISARAELGSIAGESASSRLTESNASCGAGGAVNISGEVDLDLDGTFDFDLSDRYARLLLSGAITVTVSAAFSGSITCHIEGPPLKSVFGIILAESTTGIDVSFEGSSTASLSLSGAVTLGFVLNGGTGQNLSNVDFDASASKPDTAYRLSVRPFIETDLKAFGIAGVTSNVGIDGTVGFQPPKCITIEAGLSTDFSVAIGRWGFEISATIASKEFGPFTLLKTGCSGKMWIGTVAIEARRISATSSENRFETTESATYELAPADALDAGGAGVYPAVIRGAGFTDQFGFCPFDGVVSRTGRTEWSEPGLYRRQALELTLDTDGETWLFRPPLIQGATTDESESETVMQTITFFCTGGAATVQTSQASTILGWNDGMSFEHEPLQDDDPDPDLLVGSTTWGLASGPGTSGGAVAYEYAATYDLRLVDI